MNRAKEWHINELEKYNSDIFHRPVDYEYKFYKSVQEGDIEAVIRNHEEGGFKDQSGKGILSRNPLTNIKYHFVVTASLLTRTCISGGMTNEQAYRLSDYYIQKADLCTSIDDVISTHYQMVMDFVTRMSDLKNNKAVSKSVHSTIEYIYKNLHSRITVDEIASEIGLNPNYLSKLFKKEMGISISDYIRRQKIEQAKNLLRYSNYSYIEISNYLAFVSQSHFIKVFKELEGITPKAYRDTNSSSTW